MYACLYEFIGEDQSAVWQRLASSPLPKDLGVSSLVELLTSSGETPAKAVRPRALRYPRTHAEFLREIKTRPTVEVLDVANSPDHPAYSDWMQYYVLPQALRRSRELKCAPIVPASINARPERRGQRMWARTRARPEDAVEVRARDPATWFGFDALERRGEKLFAYHYPGLDWRAPSAFEPGKAEFRLLESLSQDWEDVHQHIDAEAWAWIESARQGGRCTHIVAYDPTFVKAPVASVEAAGKHYGIRLVASSLFDL